MSYLSILFWLIFLMCTLLCICSQLFTCPYHAASQIYLTIYLTLFCCFVFHFILNEIWLNFIFLLFSDQLLTKFVAYSDKLCVGVWVCVFVFLALQAFEMCTLSGSIDSRSKTGCSSNIHWRSLYFYFSTFITFTDTLIINVWRFDNDNKVGKDGWFLSFSGQQSKTPNHGPLSEPWFFLMCVFLFIFWDVKFHMNHLSDACVCTPS